jgi:hypothetical protein
MPSKCASRWKARLPAASRPSNAVILRLRQFLPATISRATAAVISTRKALSTTVAPIQPILSEKATT